MRWIGPEHSLPGTLKSYEWFRVTYTAIGRAEIVAPTSARKRRSCPAVFVDLRRANAGVAVGLFGQESPGLLLPRANTPGCTKEACDFRDNLSVLADAGIDVVGISPDSPEKLTKFKEKYELPFSLLSDPDKEVMKAWGAVGAKKNYGKLIHGVIRSTFVVGEDQTIELAKYNVRATGHVVRILKDLGLSDK